jgi:hypothetical protein
MQRLHVTGRDRVRPVFVRLFVRVQRRKARRYWICGGFEPRRSRHFQFQSSNSRRITSSDAARRRIAQRPERASQAQHARSK